jgi:hypothetical protein
MSAHPSNAPNRATSITHDVRDFALRQFVREFEGGADVGTASRRLRGTIPPDLHWSIDEVERSFTQDELRRGSSPVAAVIDTARTHGGRPELAFVAFQRATRDLRPVLVAALSGANTIGGYLAGLLVVLSIVVAIYAIYVLPQFQVMFDLFGVQLPPLTRFLLGNALFLLPLFALALVGVVLFLVSVHKLKYRLRSLLPARPALRWLPGFGEWGARHDTCLWMRYQAIFIDAGMDADNARTCATLFAGEPVQAGQRLRLLDSAAQLGRLREELAEQLARCDQDALEQFERPRNAAVVFFRAVIYLLVSAFILAMYLPIFKLGALI